MTDPVPSKERYALRGRMVIDTQTEDLVAECWSADSAQLVTDALNRRPAPEPEPVLKEGIAWLEQEIADGDEYLQRYPDSKDELAQQENRRRFLKAVRAAQPPRDGQ